MPTTTFTAGQQVRLTASYRGKPFSPAKFVLVANPPAVALLARGTLFTVSVSRRKDRDGTRERLDDPTVLVKNADGTWCIPARLLEAVDVEQATHPKESDRDTEGRRVG